MATLHSKSALLAILTFALFACLPAHATTREKSLLATKQVMVTNGTLSFTNNSYAIVGGSSLVFTSNVDEKIFVSAWIQNIAETGSTNTFTLFLDGANMAGAGGLGKNNSTFTTLTVIGCISAKLTAGEHTVDVRAKVSTGKTATIFRGPLADEPPLLLTVTIEEGEL